MLMIPHVYTGLNNGKLPDMLSISHFNTGNSRVDLFPLPFCICLQSAYEQYSTALLIPVLNGINCYIPL